MKILYTDIYSTITVNVLGQFLNFERCVWKDVPDIIAQELIKGNFFISEKDVQFNKTLFDKKNKNLAIKRFGALGDLIMLLPVIRYINRKAERIVFTLITSECYINIFKPETETFRDVISLTKYKKQDYDRILYLDGVLEKDHSLTNSERMIHRTKLYERFFDIKVDKYDFSMKIEQFVDGVIAECF